MAYTPPTPGVTTPWGVVLNDALSDINDAAVAAQTTADGKAAATHNHAGQSLTPSGITLASGDDLDIGTMITYTPVITNIGTGTYTARGRYMYVNLHLIWVQGDITMTAAGTGSGFPTISLPVVPDRAVPAVFSLFLGDSGDGTKLIQGSTQTGASGAQIDKMVILRTPTGTTVPTILEPGDWSSKGFQGSDLLNGLVLRFSGLYFV